MAGGIIQLVASGIENSYLTDNPQITFFKSVYRRHTNFAIESIVQKFSSDANFGQTVSCTISFKGDLVNKIFVYVELPSIPKFFDQATGEEDNIKKFAWVQNLGYALIQEVSVEIGGQLIDKQYGEWLYIWSQVSNKQPGALDKMIGNIPSIYNLSNGKPSYKLYIPLEFWFCKATGLALPLVALPATDVKIIISFRKLEECYRIGPTHSIDIIEDVIPFKPGDYIEQTVNNNTISGYVIDYDYINKKLHYIKIVCPSALKRNFESMQSVDQTVPSNIYMSANYKPNTAYRIYNGMTGMNGMYCTPKPMSHENIEQTALPYKPRFINAYLYVDYIYLDKPERARFVSANNEYFIEQIQYNTEINITSPNVVQKLMLNHPCKAHYWIVQMDKLIGLNTINDLFNYTTSAIHFAPFDPNNSSLPAIVPNHYAHWCKPNREKFYGTNLVQRSNLTLNGVSRYGERSGNYTNLVQPYEHHSRGPIPGINVYSIAVNPELPQPSSSINTSMLNQIEMHQRLSPVINSCNTAKIRSYTINHNIFRVSCNLGGLLFA